MPIKKRRNCHKAAVENTISSHFARRYQQQYGESPLASMQRGDSVRLENFSHNPAHHAIESAEKCLEIV